MYNIICKFIDKTLNADLLAQLEKDKRLERRKNSKAYTDKLIKEIKAASDARNAKFIRQMESLPKAKIRPGQNSAFVTAKTLYVERTLDKEIVLKFARNSQMVICADGTWHFKGDK